MPHNQADVGDSMPEIESFTATRTRSGQWMYNEEQGISVAQLIAADATKAMNFNFGEWVGFHMDEEHCREKVAEAIAQRVNQTLDAVCEGATPPRISDLTVRCRMITEEWLLSLGCKWCPCNVHDTPDTDLMHPLGLQFWRIDDARWGCVDPQVENLRTCGDVFDLIRLYREEHANADTSAGAGAV